LIETAVHGSSIREFWSRWRQAVSALGEAGAAPTRSRGQAPRRGGDTR
jgi:hypothetical protein